MRQYTREEILDDVERILKCPNSCGRVGLGECADMMDIAREILTKAGRKE